MPTQIDSRYAPSSRPTCRRCSRSSRIRAREYGIAERGVELLEPADHALYATYQRQRSLYFVALLAAKSWAERAWRRWRARIR